MAFLLCLLLGLGGGLQHLAAQNVTSTNPNTTNAGQNITMIITGSGTNFTAATGCSLRHSVQTNVVYAGTGFVANSATNATANFSIPPNAPLGNYNLFNLNNTPVYNNALNVTVGPGSAYGLVSGKVVNDANSNCIQDANEGVAGAIVTLLPGPYYLTTGANGSFSGWVPNGTYTATTAIAGCGNWVCPASGSQPVNIATSLSTDANNDFYFHAGACSDLAANVAYTWPPFRPGFTSTITVTFRNYGPSTVNGAIGWVKFPSPLTIGVASLAPSSTNADTLFWNLGTMVSGALTTITVPVTVPVNTPLGTLILIRGRIPAIGTDPNLANNESFICQQVVGSYDPNDKQVWDLNGNIVDGPADPSITGLRYLIRFQNTGNFYAENIVVRDTIDTRLNAGTIRITGASHPYQFSLNGTRNVAFTFPNIMLPDSNANEPGSHGWISYTIDLNPGVPVGSVIQNRASIYFDFNPPILTNRTNTTLCALLTSAFNSSNTGLTFNFSNQSVGSPTTYLWDFGDGGTSTSANPSHTYAANGTYTVCLTIGNGCRTSSICDTIITCQMPMTAFTSTATSALATFTDQSHPSTTAWAWDFGDGGTSTLQNPTHIYAVNGTYNVCLTSSNGCGSQTTCHSVTICRALNEAFASTTSGLAATFQDQSDVSATTWAWDFGDGGTSSLQNPNHAYASPGTYNVCLTVGSGCTSATICHSVVVCANLNENFSNSIVGPTVSFTDLSDVSANAWSWDFGDGGTSTLQNPVHSYASGAMYNVCLTVSNACYSATTCTQVDLCQPTNPALSYVQASGLSYNFTGTADPSVNVWHWDFGDGNTSPLQSPAHTYGSAGTYLVCLTVQNACFTTDTCTTITLVGIDGQQGTSFTVYPSPGTGLFTLSASLPTQGDLRMRVYDGKGSLILQRERIGTGNTFLDVIDLSREANGLYFLQLEYAGQVKTLRMEKQ